MICNLVYTIHYTIHKYSRAIKNSKSFHQASDNLTFRLHAPYKLVVFNPGSWPKSRSQEPEVGLPIYMYTAPSFIQCSRLFSVTTQCACLPVYFTPHRLTIYAVLWFQCWPNSFKAFLDKHDVAALGRRASMVALLSALWWQRQVWKLPVAPGGDSCPTDGETR